PDRGRPPVLGSRPRRAHRTGPVPTDDDDHDSAVDTHGAADPRLSLRSAETADAGARVAGANPGAEHRTVTAARFLTAGHSVRIPVRDPGRWEQSAGAGMSTRPRTALRPGARSEEHTSEL